MIIECKPVTSGSAILTSEWYEHNWLYVFRRKDIANQLSKEAYRMTANGVKYRYENPGFGEIDWCCVTFLSYVICCVLGLGWDFGTSYNKYFWSPRHGDGWDSFLLTNGFTKMTYSGTAYLEDGDIVVSNDHSVMYTSLSDDSKPSTTATVEITLPVLEIGSTGGYVKTLQALLNFYNYADLLVDGKFQALTKKAVENYQQSRGLPVTGIVAEMTWNQLLK